MAEAPTTDTASPEAQLQSQEDSALQTVDLQTQRSGVQKPVLQFEGGSNQMPTESGPPMEHVELEGTELHARPRTGSKGATLKEWSSHQIKLTKQLVSEKFGRGLRTVDPKLDSRIETLKETQRKYGQLIALTTQFHINFVHVVETQKSLAEHFAFMSVRAPELHTEFHYNAESQKTVARNGETLLAAVKFFVSNMQTVCTKTMEDTLQTVKVYESARLAYDAYRSDLESLKKQADTSQAAASRLPATTSEFEKHKAKFEQLRHDVDIKLKLLDENKVILVIVVKLSPHVGCIVLAIWNRWEIVASSC